jgi:hypothetical protein
LSITFRHRWWQGPDVETKFVDVQKSSVEVEREIQSLWQRFMQAAAQGDVVAAKAFIRANNLNADRLKIMTPAMLQGMASKYVDMGMDPPRNYMVLATVIYRQPSGTFDAYPIMFVHTDRGWLIEEF